MQAKLQDLLNKFLARYSDLGLAAMVVGIIAMLIIPLPSLVMDLLLVLNMAISVLLLIVSLYLSSALKISAFPSILLITTLFRLALNVSSTRLILLYADAGDVIESFGNFVVRGNYVVGGVIFLILTLIQFLVIAKGSERVSEVAARFTLDAMPGKQMSIDADLRAGAFDLDEARRRRSAVQRESQLYGAMDGAMKFVKGDAIAGLIMTAINLIAGMIVGIMQKGMTVGVAAQKYTLLTIGDGLVSQIPALLIATTAGVIVTRVAGAEGDGPGHLGGDVFGQLMAYPKAIAITSVLLFGLGVIPGMPTIPFMLMGTFVALVAWGLMHKGTTGAVMSEAEATELEQVESQAKEGAKQARAMIPAMTPLTLDIGAGLTADMEGDQLTWFNEMIPTMREGIFYDLGVKVPGVRVRLDSAACGPRQLLVCMDEIPVTTGEVPAGQVLVNESAQGLKVFQVEADETRHPISRQKVCWVPAADGPMLKDAGYTTWDTSAYILLRLTAALRAHAAELVEIQTVQGMLEQLEGPYPALVQEVVPKLLGLPVLTEILRRLVEEEISLRQLPRILQLLADRAKTIKDPVLLTEEVRSGLNRYITHKYSAADGSLVVYMVDREIEEMVAGSIRVSDQGSYLALPPDVTREILAAISRNISADVEAGRTPVLLTDQRVRRYVKRLAALEAKDVVVLAYQELDPALQVQPLGRISVRG
jgi:type III secretion protein V